MTHNSIAQDILNIAIEIAERQKHYNNQLNSFGELDQEKAFSDLLDIFGSYKNLLIELNAKSVSYDHSALNASLLMAEQNLKNSDLELEAVNVEVENDPLYKFSKNFWLSRITIAGIALLSIEVIETLSLDKIFLLAPMCVYLCIISPIVIRIIRLKKNRRKYNVALDAHYMIQSLSNHIDK